MSVCEVTTEGRVRTLCLNRPEKKNALNREMAWAIITAVEEAAHDDEVWVVAITGKGNAFCVGADLTETALDGEPPLTRQEQSLDDVGWVGRLPLVLRMVCDKPVVAGLNGLVAGAGISLAMACDLRLGARRLRFLAGYPTIGAPPDGGLTWTMPQAVGYERTMRFLLENRTVDANEALELGLVGEVVATNKFVERLADYCGILAENSPIAARLTKRALVKATAIDLDSHVRFELANIQRALQSEDAREAQMAFFEKRAPLFRGL